LSVKNKNKEKQYDYRFHCVISWRWYIIYSKASANFRYTIQLRNFIIIVTAENPHPQKQRGRVVVWCLLYRGGGGGVIGKGKPVHINNITEQG